MHQQLHDLPAGAEPVRLINTSAALALCIADLSAQASIAFDLEFDNNLRGYGITLCLIQVATPQTCYLIDPLAGLDMSALYGIFQEERIEKVVHSPGEDLRLLHSLGCYPKNLFDVQVVAILLNYEHISLAALLAEKMDLTLSKGQQRSDWKQRPLSQAQLLYAAADVLWLHRLKELLITEATPKRLMPFVQEEQAALSTTIYRTEAKLHFLKPADQHKLSPRDQYILNGMFRYRDGLARRLNKPAFQVMDEAVVRALCEGTLQPEELSTARGLHHSLKGSQAIDTIKDCLKELQEEATVLTLATILPKRKSLTQAEHAAREQANKDKLEKFNPVQEALAADFGLYAARFMLSNGTVNDLLLETIKLSDLRPYRQEQISRICTKLNIDLSKYK